MSERIHALAQELFGKSSVEECDLQELKALAHQYPYFAPAQFLLLEKLKQENSPEYSAQLQKAVLLYHNPLEFEYFISSDRFYTDVIFDEEPKQDIQTVEEVFQVSGDIIQEDASEKEIINEEKITERVEEENGLPINYPEKTESDFQEAYPVPEISSEHEQQVLQNIVIDEPAEEIQNNIVKEELSVSNEQLTVNQQPENNNIDKTLQDQTEIELAFEPFHTVDYFASQGIKLSQEEVPKDKFGKQLKSFTEWLKTMKRLPASEITTNVDPSSEKNVQHLAEDSVHDPNVVTEVMAEVWLKQGNTQKAREVYNKLSLLNPSKRAYFAAKIENLKDS